MPETADMKNLSTARPRPHTLLSSIILTFLSFTVFTHALPSPDNIISLVNAAQPNLAAANLTGLTCTPRPDSSSDVEFKPLNSTTCRYSLANFTNTYNHSSVSNSPDTNLTLSASPARVRKNPATTVLVPVEVAPAEEENFVGGACSVVFAVYYGSNKTLPDVNVTLSQLAQAAEKVINACTGGTEGGNTGNGGGVILTTPAGKIIDVTVQRPV